MASSVSETEMSFSSSSVLNFSKNFAFGQAVLPGFLSDLELELSLIESILRLSIEKRGIVLMLMLILLITGLGL